MFFSNSILFWRISVISFNFCVLLLWLFMQLMWNAICKSRHWHFSISSDNANFYVSLKIFFLWKFIYLAPVHFETITYFSITFFHLVRDIHGCFSLNFWSNCLKFWNTHSLAFQKEVEIQNSTAFAGVGRPLVSICSSLC